MSDSSSPAPTGAPLDKGLAPDRLGLWSSTVIGLSSTAPLYSLAASLGLIVVAVGAQAPVALVLGFVPMLLTAFAYKELSTAVPDSGTAFTWATKAFGPRTGWLSGWGVVVAGVIVMANQTEIAARYFWLLVGGEAAGDNQLLVTGTGALVIAAMTWISYRNVETGARTQYLLIGIQYAAVLALVVGIGLALAAGTAPYPTAFSWTWFDPFALVDDLPGLVEAVLIAIFIYWGWDTCLAMSEETKDPHRTPGRAALLSSSLLVVTYVAVTVAVLRYAGTGEEGVGLANPENADDVLFGLGSAVLGPAGWFVVAAVAVSALATCQTTILPTARGTFAMAVYRALPASFGKVHPRHLTPTVSTLAMGAASLVFYVVMSLLSENMLADTVEATSLAVAAVYAVTSFAAVRYFRGTWFQNARNLVFRLVLPLLGGILMTAIFVYSLVTMADPEYGSTRLLGVGGVFLTAVVALATGVLLMLLWGRSPASRDFFEGRSLNRQTEVRAPE